MSRCIFCDILAGNAPASIIYRDARCTAFMDTQPVNPGHVLVIPNRHASDLEELDPKDGAQMFLVAQGIAGALRTCGVRCAGVNLFLADGKAAGQEVFHAHLHVIPRFTGDGFGLTFSPSYENKPLRAELDRVAEQVRAAIGSS